MSNPSVKKNLYLSWVLANIIGFVVGAAVGIKLSRLAGPAGPLTVSIFVFSAMLGVSIGLAQWVVLLRWVRADLWILASTVGWLLGFPISYPISFAVAMFLLSSQGSAKENLFFSLAVGGAILGALIGLAQWLVLRNQMSGSSLWIWFNVVGYSLSYAIASPGIFGLLNWNLPTKLPTELIRIGFVLLFGMISSGITGATLEQLLRHSRSTKQD